MIEFKNKTLNLIDECICVAAGKNLVRDVDMDQVDTIVIKKNARVLLVNASLKRLYIEDGATVTLTNCAVVEGVWSDFCNVTVTDSIVKNCSLRGSVAATRSTIVNCDLTGTMYLDCCFGCCTFVGWYHCFGCLFHCCTFDPDDPGDDDEMYDVYSCCTFVDCENNHLHGTIFDSSRHMKSSDRAFCILTKLMCAGLNNDEFKQHADYKKLVQFANRASVLLDDDNFINAEDALKFALIRYRNCISDGDKHTIGWMANIDDNQW